MLDDDLRTLARSVAAAGDSPFPKMIARQGEGRRRARDEAETLTIRPSTGAGRACCFVLHPEVRLVDR